MRLVSPAVFLDIASLWPVGIGLLGAGWAAKKVRPQAPIARAPLAGLLVFSWILVSTAFYFADLPGLPSSSADLRGPPADQVRFDTFSVEPAGGRLLLAAGTGPASYRVDMVRGGGGAGVPVAVERGGAEGGEVRVIDARRPLPDDLGATVDDNAWLRFAGWEVGLHPGTTWHLNLVSADLTADLRALPVASLGVTGGGTVQLGEASGPVPIVITGDFTVEVPPVTAVRVMGAAIVPEEWTVVDDTAWFGNPEAGWQIEVADGGSAQVIFDAG